MNKPEIICIASLVATVSLQELRDALKLCHGIYPSDRTPWRNLEGIHLDFEAKRGEVAHSVSADGYRMVVYPLRTTEVVQEDTHGNLGGVTIEKSDVPALMEHLAALPSGRVRIDAKLWGLIDARGGPVGVAAKIAEKTVNTISADYPDWGVIADEFGGYGGDGIDINVRRLNAALDIVTRHISKGFRGADIKARRELPFDWRMYRPFDIFVENNELYVGTEGLEGFFGDLKLPLDAKIGGRPPRMRLNAALLKSLTKRARVNVRMLTRAQNDAVSIQIDDSPALVLLMPMRI